eukprot:4049877-Pyramimonas_sp.AAC.2
MSFARSWEDTTRRTEVVYARALRTRGDDVLTRLSQFYKCGPFAGKLFCCVVAVNYLYWRWLDWWLPAEGIDVAPDVVPMSDGMMHRPVGEGRMEHRPTTASTRHSS